MIMLEAILGGLAKQGVFAVGRKAWQAWVKSTLVEQVIADVDLYFSPKYEGIGDRLRGWLVNESIHEKLSGLNQGAPPTVAELESLVAALDLTELFTGDLEESQVLAGEVLGRFFGTLYDKVLNSPEGQAIQTKHLDHRLDRIDKQLEIVTSEALADRSSAPQGVRDDFAPVRALLRTGMVKSALAWLDARENELKDSPGEHETYELWANRGLAFMQLEEWEKADEALRRALKVKPDRANALANMGLILLLRGKWDESKKHIEAALEIEPNNPSALKVYPQVLSRTDGYEQAVQAASKIQDDGDRATVLGFLHFNANRTNDAVRELSKAVAITPENVDALFHLAQAQATLFQKSVQNKGLAPWSNLPDDLRDLFDNVNKNLDTAVDLYRERELPSSLARALLSRSSVLSYQDNPKAFEDYEEATRLDGRNADAAKIIASFMVRAGRAGEAQRVLERQRKEGEFNADIELMYASVLDSDDMFDDAISVLENPDLRKSAGEVPCALARIDILLNHEKLDEAESALDKVTKESPGWQVLLRRARLQSVRQDSKGAIATLRTAINDAPKHEQWQIRLMVTDQLMKLEQWDKAHIELQAVISTSSPPQLIHKYLVALFNDRHWRECVEFAKQVREKRGILVEVAGIEARVLAALGRIGESDEILQMLEEQDAKRARWRLERAQNAQRSGNGDAALRLVPDATDISDLSGNEAMVAAHIRELNGDLLGAIELVYQMRLAKASVPETHMAYIGFFLRVSPNIRNILDRDTAEVGTQIILEQNKEQQVFELVEGNEIREAECSITSQLGKRLLGKRVGDGVVLRSDEYGDDTWTIKEIKSKYVGLFQKTLNEFNTRFPEADGFRRFMVANGNFDPIFKSLDRKSAFVEQSREIYQSRSLPIASMAQVVGGHDVELWYTLISGILGRVYVYNPDPKIREEMISDCRESNCLVLEVTTICALAELSLLSEIPTLDKKLIAPQETLDLLEGVRDELKPEPVMTMGKVRGQYVRQKHSEEDIRKRREFWDSVIKWVRENVEVMPYDVPSGDEFKRLHMILSGPALGSMLLASTKKACMLTEDYRLRQLARNEHGVHGAASVEVARLLHEGLHIDDRKYNAVLLQTALWHYHFTPVTVEMMIEALILDDRVPGANLLGLLETMKDPDTNDSSIADVMSKFLREAFLHHTMTPERQQALVFVCLDTLAARPGRISALRKFENRLTVIFHLMPLQLGEIRRIVRVWARLRVH